jgi:hypothetical protein
MSHFAQCGRKSSDMRVQVLKLGNSRANWDKFAHYTKSMIVAWPGLL